MNVMDSGDESDDEPISTEMLEDVFDGSQSHPNVIKYMIVLSKNNRNV